MKESIVGNFNIIPKNLPAEGEFNMKVKPIDLITSWRRCSIISNFVGDFYSNFESFYVMDANLISTIFNELLENAVKYSTRRESEISMNIGVYDSIFKIQIENSTSEQHFEFLKKYLEEILQLSDLESFYVNKVESKLSSNSESEIGIGLIILLKDYDIKLGARFLQEENNFSICIQAYYNFNN
ncbi:MAG: GHKL domain-containing protein [Saprospiraceae bacterium]|nr:GHKL domain-containing protein [Saprospiraceae bacterium]